MRSFVVLLLFTLKIDSGFWESVNTALLIILVVIFQVFLREFYFVLLVLILEKKKKVVKSFDFEIKHILSYRSFGVILRHFK